MKSEHEKYLNILIRSLDEVGEDYSSLELLIKEGQWYQDKKNSLYKLADLILIYYDNHASALELKHCKKGRHKALEQLRSTEKLINYLFKIYDVTLKVVYYDKPFHYETIK